jgi:Zn-dependent peptidase ImmA (M78 family)
MVQLVQYKERFGISLAAMIYRARKSNILSQRLYQRLWRDFARLGYRDQEPGNVAADRPLRMEALIDASVSAGRTSYNDIARIAGIDAAVLKERVLSAMGAPMRSQGRSATLKFQAYQKRFDRNN